MVRYAIGIDIGGTHTKIGLVASPSRREDAQVSSEKANPLEASPRLVDCQMIDSDLQARDATAFLARANEIVEGYVWGTPVEGIGIALCSLINESHTGALLSVNAPALNNLNIKAEFEARFNLPILLSNDVNAYALAEYYFGAGEGVKRLLCLGLGTGLAIASIINGKLIETWGGIGGDAGRIILDPQAEVFCKGQVRGSAEALCGTAHIERLARQAYGREVSAREVIAACHAGEDPAAGAVMSEIGSNAGHLLAILSAIYFPQRIVITGGTAEAGEPFFRAVRSRYTALIGDYMTGLTALETGIARPVEIVKGVLGSEAAVIGAVLAFLA